MEVFPVCDISKVFFHFKTLHVFFFFPLSLKAKCFPSLTQQVSPFLSDSLVERPTLYLAKRKKMSEVFLLSQKTSKCSFFSLRVGSSSFSPAEVSFFSRWNVESPLSLSLSLVKTSVVFFVFFRLFLATASKVLSSAGL